MLQSINNTINFERNYSSRRKDQIVRQSDEQLLAIAKRHTERKMHEKRHNALYFTTLASVPVIAGIAKTLTSTSATVSRKLFDGAKSGGKAALAMGVIAAVFGINKKLTEKSNTVSKVEQNNPVISIITTAALSAGAALLAVKGAGKGLNALKGAEFMKGTITNMKKYAGKINNHSWTTSIASAWNSVKKHTPNWIKTTLKPVLPYTAAAVGITAVAHDIDHDNKRNLNIIRDYSKLKHRQIAIAQELYEERASRCEDCE